MNQNNSIFQILSLPALPEPPGGVFLDLGTTAKRAAVDAYELVGGNGWGGGAVVQREREVVTTVTQGNSSHFGGCGFRAYCSTIYFHSFSVPVSIRQNPKNRAGGEEKE